MENMQNKSLGKPQIIFKDTDGESAGEVEAVFSVFDLRDHDGDVVLSGAIPNESKVTMAWGHDWTKPIGKGVVVTDDKKATFKGRFFTDTDAGNEAYKTVKNMADDQEWSWGFIAKETRDGDPDSYDGKKTREIVTADIFEVSPVLRGANPATQTVAIKNMKQKTFAEQCSEVLEQVKTLSERGNSLAELRAKENRSIGKESRGQIESIANELSQLTPNLHSLAQGNNSDDYGNDDMVSQAIHHFEQTNLRMTELRRS